MVNSSCSLTIVSAESIGLVSSRLYMVCLVAASMVELSTLSDQLRGLNGGQNSAYSLHLELRKRSGFHASVRGNGREAHSADRRQIARRAVAARGARRPGADARRCHPRSDSQHRLLDVAREEI